MSDEKVLERLFNIIESRKGADPKTSWTAKLFSQGRGKIAQKVGEEAVEVNIAALTEGPDALASESADLLYHLLVMWADAGVKPQDVWAKLAAREGVSGIAEKNARVGADTPGTDTLDTDAPGKGGGNDDDL